MGSILVYDKIKMQKMLFGTIAPRFRHTFFFKFRLINVYLFNVNKCFCTERVHISLDLRQGYDPINPL